MNLPKSGPLARFTTPITFGPYAPPHALPPPLPRPLDRAPLHISSLLHPMATTPAKTFATYRLVFYGICRTSGRLRTRAFTSTGATPSDIEQAATLAREKLRLPRFVTATRSPGR